MGIIILVSAKGDMGVEYKLGNANGGQLLKNYVPALWQGSNFGRGVGIRYSINSSNLREGAKKHP